MSLAIRTKLALGACWPGARPDLSISRRATSCLGRMLSAAACMGKGPHQFQRPSKTFLSQLSSHFPLSPVRVPASTSIRTSHPRLRRAADGGAIMGLQVSRTGGLCVGLSPFPPFPDFPQFHVRCLLHFRSSRVRTYQDRIWSWLQVPSFLANSSLSIG